MGARREEALLPSASLGASPTSGILWSRKVEGMRADELEQQSSSTATSEWRGSKQLEPTKEDSKLSYYEQSRFWSRWSRGERGTDLRQGGQKVGEPLESWLDGNRRMETRTPPLPIGNVATSSATGIKLAVGTVGLDFQGDSTSSRQFSPRTDEIPAPLDALSISGPHPLRSKNDKPGLRLYRNAVGAMAPLKRNVLKSPSSSSGYRKEQEYGATSGEFESRDLETIPRAESPVTASPGTASNFEGGKIYSSTLGGSVGQSLQTFSGAPSGSIFSQHDTESRPILAEAFNSPPGAPSLAASTLSAEGFKPFLQPALAKHFPLAYDSDSSQNLDKQASPTVATRTRIHPWEESVLLSSNSFNLENTTKGSASVPSKPIFSHYASDAVRRQVGPAVSSSPNQVEAFLSEADKSRGDQARIGSRTVQPNIPPPQTAPLSSFWEVDSARDAQNAHQRKFQAPSTREVLPPLGETESRLRSWGPSDPGRGRESNEASSVSISDWQAPIKMEGYRSVDWNSRTQPPLLVGAYAHYASQDNDPNYERFGLMESPLESLTPEPSSLEYYHQQQSDYRPSLLQTSSAPTMFRPAPIPHLSTKFSHGSVGAPTHLRSEETFYPGASSTVDYSSQYYPSDYSNYSDHPQNIYPASFVPGVYSNQAREDGRSFPRPGAMLPVSPCLPRPPMPSPYYRSTACPPSYFNQYNVRQGDPHRSLASFPMSSLTLSDYLPSEQPALARGQLAQARFRQSIQEAEAKKGMSNLGRTSGSSAIVPTKRGVLSQGALGLSKAAADAALIEAKSNASLPRPPARGAHAMWVGSRKIFLSLEGICLLNNPPISLDVPTDASYAELWAFFDSCPPPSTAAVFASTRVKNVKDAAGNMVDLTTIGVESIHLISRSNCAFVNFVSDLHLRHAVSVVNGSSLRPHLAGPRLSCRIRQEHEDLKSGVGNQRTGGMHRAYIENLEADRRLNNSSALSSESENRPPSSNEGSVATSTSSFLGQHFPCRYFILKAHDENDFKVSVESGLWATQIHNEPILDQAYRTASDAVYLVFSANKTGEWYGYAKMAGPISSPGSLSADLSSEVPIDKQLDTQAESFVAPNTEERFGSEGAPNLPKPFKVDWIKVKRLSFNLTHHIRNSFNSSKECKIARDGTEIEPVAGHQLLEAFWKADGGMPAQLSDESLSSRQIY